MSDTSTARDEMRAALADLLARAASVDPDDALTGETPLSVELSGKYLNILFSTGGPHTEMLVEYWSDDDAAEWWDAAPAGGWFTRKDWGTREDVYVSADDAAAIVTAILRDADNLADNLPDPSGDED